jgi:hypothetical protein
VKHSVKSWSEWLSIAQAREGNNTKVGSLDLADQLQPVIVVDDFSATHQPPPVPVANVRASQGAVAGEHSVVSFRAGPAGSFITELGNPTGANTGAIVFQTLPASLGLATALTPRAPSLVPLLSSAWSQGSVLPAALTFTVEDPDYVIGSASSRPVELWVPPNRFAILFNRAANGAVTLVITVQDVPFTQPG